MPTSRHILAATNNALWCDAVCRAHGCACRFESDAWFTIDPPPPYYSSLVTIRGEESAAAQVDLIRRLVEADPTRAFGFKDSFACIDIGSIKGRKFERLFDATWIWRDASAPPPEEPSLQWRRIATDASLLKWESAWRGNDANAESPSGFRQFPVSLLGNADIRFLAGCHERGEIVAVAIANRTDDVVGLSNVFSANGDARELWQGATLAAVQAFPALPLVGYERGPDLSMATEVGFEMVGPLRVWVLR